MHDKPRGKTVAGKSGEGKVSAVAQQTSLFKMTAPDEPGRPKFAAGLRGASAALAGSPWDSKLTLAQPLGENQ
jgi:hypothetical protein